MIMPGRLLHRVAALVCSPDTLDRIVEPAIADLQKEFTEAEIPRAWALAAGYAAVLKVIAVCAFSVSVSTGEERRAIARTMAWSVAFTIGLTGLLMLAPLSVVDESLSASGLAALIPQAIPLAIPIGLAFGVALGTLGRTATRDVARVILLAACLASIASFATLAWLMPAGNQAFRESMAQAAGITGPLTRGPSEMTLSELDRQAAIGAAVGGTPYAWHFHLRFALSVASVALASLVLATSIGRRRLRVLAALLACLAYWALIYAGEGLAVYGAAGHHWLGTMPIIFGAWLPNIVFAAIVIVMASSRGPAEVRPG